MSSASTVRTDDSSLSRVDQVLFRLESALNMAGGMVVLMLMLLAVAQIFGRKLFNQPIPGFIDWVEQFMAVFAFVGIAYCQRLGGHIRMDILIGRFRGRSLWMIELANTVVILLLTSALIYGSWLHFRRALDLGDSTIDIALPTWPAKLVVPLALGVLWLRLVVQLFGYWRAFKRSETEPVAVPLIEDAATIAEREVESALSDTDTPGGEPAR
ncbi:MAG: TRAP transporter small permease [Burkholderiales bacterium]|nr:MAG: TRAP transporter small permease [Burkholderiales bacterium]